MGLIYRKKPDCFGRWYKGRLCIMCSGTDKIFCEVATHNREYDKWNESNRK